MADNKKEEAEVSSTEEDTTKEEDEAGDDENSEEPKNEEAAKKKDEDEKKKYQNWPLREIKDPHENDVLYGRGGGTNHHPGNKRYRKLVEERKMDYVNSKRLDKPLVALEIIRHWRGQMPPGRFLKLDEKTGLWHDVGDKKAREKTSQALREKAPLLRKQQEEEELERIRPENDEDGERITKSTRFAEGTNTENKPGGSIKRAVLARDHSLGREYLESGEAVTLEGFSWEEPMEQITGEQVDSPGPGYPSGRSGSQGSMARTGSQGGMPPQDYTGYHQRLPSGDRQQHFSSGRYESWGQGNATMPPPPMPGYGGQYPYDSSGSFPPQISMAREHSLKGNPLRGASVTHPVPPGCFESGRAGSGYWAEPPPMPPPPYQPSWPSQVPPPRYLSSESSSGYAHKPSGCEYDRRSTGSTEEERPMRPSPAGSTPSPPYAVDPVIAKTWSSQSRDYEKGANLMGVGDSRSDEKRYRAGEGYEYKTQRRPDNAAPLSSSSTTTSSNGSPLKQYPKALNVEQKQSDSEVPRPSIVKRATSNQNETTETKRDLRGPSVKRAALNRDNSLASNRLKEAYLADMVNKQVFDSDREMNLLNNSMKQSNLSETKTTRPKPMSASERTSTVDKIAMELMVKPDPLVSNQRSSTIDALALDFDDDSLARPEPISRLSTMDALVSELNGEVFAKPPALTSEGRTSTMDALFAGIVNDPVDGNGTSLGAPLDLSRGASVSEWLKEV